MPTFRTPNRIILLPILNFPCHNYSGAPWLIQYFLITEELQSVRESESRLKQQYAESQRRERILVRRLAVKEQEIQDYAVKQLT